VGRSVDSSTPQARSNKGRRSKATAERVNERKAGGNVGLNISNHLLFSYVPDV
jgi:hypothetical protein